MNVIICGMNDFGFSVAKYFSKFDINVTVIDQNEQLISKISESIDVQGIFGVPSYPDVLERAGIKNADMILVLTESDEMNMITCQIAHYLFGIKSKIACIRNKNYLEEKWNKIFDKNNIDIDIIFSPERELAKSICNNFTVPGAFRVIPLVNNLVKIIGIKCTSESSVINTPLSHIPKLFPKLEIVILGIVRQGSYIVPIDSDILLNGDEVYFSISNEQVFDAIRAFRPAIDKIERLLILGGGDVGLYLSHDLEVNNGDISVKIIEKNKKRAEFLASTLKKTIVLCGDVLDEEVLTEANIKNTDCVIAVTKGDKVNMLSCLVSRYCGASSNIALINNYNYLSLITSLGIDAIIDRQAISLSKILHCIRQESVKEAHSICSNLGEVLQVDISEDSNLVGAEVKKVNMPRELIVVAIVRDEKFVFPEPSTIININDKVVLMVASDSISKIERIIAKKLDYFKM